MNKLQVYKKYFETASDDTHLVMHRGYSLALVKMLEEKQKEVDELNQAKSLAGKQAFEYMQYWEKSKQKVERYEKTLKVIKNQNI